MARKSDSVSAYALFGARCQKVTSSPNAGTYTDRMEREWDLHVELSCDTDHIPLSGSFERDVYHLIREALVNAVRHGEASLVRVAVGPEQAGLLPISIADNGRGFPFAGRYTADELASLDLGPKTLRDRVRAMGGSLTLESGDQGATLSVALPRGAVA